MVAALPLCFLLLAPTSKAGWQDEGIARAENGDPRGAEAMLAMALALDFTDAESWAYLGRIEKRLGDRGRAQRFFERAVALDPMGSAHHDLGDLALAAGDAARAEREYGADLAAEPTCAEARTNRAALLLGGGDGARAAADYVAALAFHPDDAAAAAGLERALATVRRPRPPWLVAGLLGVTALAVFAMGVRKRRPA